MARFNGCSIKTEQISTERLLGLIFRRTDSMRRALTSQNFGMWDAASALAWNDPCARQIDINTQREPWKGPKPRRAISLSIDRKAIATGGLRRHRRAIAHDVSGIRRDEAVHRSGQQCRIRRGTDLRS